MDEGLGYIIEHRRILVFEIAKETAKTITPVSKYARNLINADDIFHYIGNRLHKDAVFRSRDAAIDAFRALLTSDVEAAKRRLEAAEAGLRALNEGAS